MNALIRKSRFSAFVLLIAIVGLVSVQMVTEPSFGHSSSHQLSQPSTATVAQAIKAIDAEQGEATEATDARLQYNRDIRPILSANCFACHGPDSASREADLRIDQPEAAYDREVWIPGKPDESFGIDRILTDDESLMMPPIDSHKELTEAQKKTLVEWVEQGAEYEPHWSFIAPERPDVPEVKNSDWVRNPIDAFILAKLEEQQLEPAPEADRYTLARRAALDLTGLPPTREMVASFVNDTSENAYEKYLDRLLASDRWGEHRARYWLDVARYADTHGIHFDNFREMWTYRDWVIGAFNNNLPYDEFTIESLAGDLLPDPTLSQQIASGFNRCNITTNEGGIIDEEYLVLYTRDRTETVAKVWMGLTANCAVCHDHKFDPLSQREFYEMSAFFNNTTQGARDGNISDTPPIVMVPKQEDRERWADLEALVPAAQAKLTKRRGEANGAFDEWLASNGTRNDSEAIKSNGLLFETSFEQGPDATASYFLSGQTHDLKLAESAKWISQPVYGNAIQYQGMAAEIADFPNFPGSEPYSFAAWVKAPAANMTGALAAKMNEAQAYRGFDFWMQDRRLGTHLISAWPDKGLKVVSATQIPADQWTHVIVTYDGSTKAAGVKVYYNGVAQNVSIENDKLDGPTETDVPLKLGQRHSASPLSNVGISKLQIFKRALSAEEVSLLAVEPVINRLAVNVTNEGDVEPNIEMDEATRKRLHELAFNWWLENKDEAYQSHAVEFNALKAEQDQIKSRSSVAHVMNEKEGVPEAFVLNRGEYDQRRDKVAAKTPEILPAFPEDLPRNRLGLAKWLLQENQPLTTRVTVNRFWQEIFGTGIVRTAGDFGITGELPTHPELLDWLAIEFRETGWDVKRFYKMMLMSATYRQSSQTSPDKLDKDFDNRLLSRGPRFRMDAEMVRDYALACSDILSDTIGGPSVKPYQPPGVWEAVAMIGSNTRNYQRDSGESLYRRSMYTFWKRSAPPASMDTFNAPSREYCVVQRERTNTPLQALTTLNDTQFVEAARVLAEQLVKKHADDAQAACLELFEIVVCRTPTADELTLLMQLHEDYLGTYNGDIEAAQALTSVGEYENVEGLDPTLVASLTMVANAVFNLDEVLNK